MAKPEQVLIIEPQHELTFVGPFTTAVSAVMSLKNPTDRKLCFKIKTTAPKRYCVKPNSGVIDPKQKVQVAVSLQPFEYDPLEKNRHKFMVQAMYAPEGEINSDSLWKETDSSNLMDSKLKCVFVMPMPDSNNVTANGAATSETSKPASEFHAATNSASGELKKSVDEIRNLQTEISTLRQENLQLKEEALRQKRLASSRSGIGNEVSSRSGAGSHDSFTVQAMSPDATALSTTYIYAALVVLILGIIIGKWIF
eukprot:05625.XXX_304560_306668_1 [CDS] Oithona nana genome sequencing.